MLPDDRPFLLLQLYFHTDYANPIYSVNGGYRRLTL